MHKEMLDSKFIRCMIGKQKHLDFVKITNVRIKDMRNRELAMKRIGFGHELNQGPDFFIWS